MKRFFIERIKLQNEQKKRGKSLMTKTHLKRSTEGIRLERREKKARMIHLKAEYEGINDADAFQIFSFFFVLQSFHFPFA